MQFILSGSKQFRKNGGPHLKGSRRPRKKVARPLLLRRPKVGFFGAQADFFFFFFLAPSRYGVRRSNNFFDTPKKISAPTFFFRPPIYFSAAFLFFRRLKQKIKNRLFRRAPIIGSNIFRRPSRKTSAFFFFSAPPRYGVRRPNNFFEPPKIFFGVFFFLGAPKNRRFLAPKTKNRLFRRALKEQRPKNCILGSTTIRASGDENCPSNGLPGFGFFVEPIWRFHEGSNEGFMKPP